MNTIRTVSVKTTLNNPNVSFMLNIPFEVDLIRLVDCRSFSLMGAPYYVCIPTVSFIPNQPLCLANTGVNCNPIDFHFKQPKVINGLHTINLTFGGGLIGVMSYIGLIFEFWNTTIGIPLQIKQTNWQNECIDVSTSTNTFPLDIMFPVDEIIIEDMNFQGFKVVVDSSLTFYTDFLPQEPVYKNKETNLNVCRTGGSTLGMCSTGVSMIRPNKIRYRFAQPITIRGNYRIWFEADPVVYGVGVNRSSVWGSATFLFKFISYR